VADPAHLSLVVLATGWPLVPALPRLRGGLARHRAIRTNPPSSRTRASRASSATISTPVNWYQSVFLLGNGAFGSNTRNDTSPEAKVAQVKLLREVLRRNAALGYGDYRAPPVLQDAVADQYSFNNFALRRFNERLKDAIDPNGIILPGRGGVWPRALRALRGALRK